MGTNISLTKRQLYKPKKPSDNKYLVDVVGKNWACLIVWLVVLGVTLKVFRSGGRTNLSFVGWIINHTVYGPPVEYVPLEDYVRELEGVWIDEQGNLRW